jgi:prepilin signal peptidase PulO-like enzyme (type II secretory pathway)
MLLIALSPSRAALMASLPLCLTAAAACDLRSRRIPNALTALTAFAGFVIALSGLGPASWQDGLVAGGISITVGMVLHAVRVIGGGDVKLFAASALWLGPLRNGRCGVGNRDLRWHPRAVLSARAPRCPAGAVTRRAPAIEQRR